MLLTVCAVLLRRFHDCPATTIGSILGFSPVTGSARQINAKAVIPLADAMIRTSQGDRQAFRQVYVLTSNKLFGICLHICQERPAAEDVLHDVFHTVWRRADRWDARRGTPITWLAAIARNRSIDWRRSQKSLPLTTPIDDGHQIADTSANAESMLISAETHLQVGASLDALEPFARDAIRSAFFDGFTYAELAERHGVPLGTMKSCIRRGLAKLRTDLELAGVS